MNMMHGLSMISKDQGKDAAVTPCHEAMPALGPTSEGEGEESSLDSSSSSRHQQASASCGSRKLSFQKKRVSWDKIHKREYALVVGDHPLCQDGLPVSLDWQFNDACSDFLEQAIKVSERKQSYVFPRRLSYEERRERLNSVSGLTAEQIQNQEIDLVVRTLKESWEQVTVANAEMDQKQMEPLTDVMLWEDLSGMDMDMDVDLGDLSNFEWTD
jgi:hypothetical protein